MDTPPKQRPTWVTIVPLVALAGFGLAWLAHRPTPPRTLEIELTPPTQGELGEIPLPPRVRALEGTIVEPDGAPAADALVWVLSGDEPHWAYTDARGAFALQHLQRGPWDVRVLAQEHLPFEVALRDAGAPQEIRLPDARRAPPRLATLPRADLVGALAGAPVDVVAGAEVVLTPIAPPEELDAPLPRRVLADAAGRFEVPGLIAGAYRVEVLPAWARGGSWPDLARALDVAEPRRLDHDPSQVAPRTIELAAGGVQGVLADAAGRPLEGALALVAPADRPERTWPPIATDARGAFALAGLPAGRYALTARAGVAAWTLPFTVEAGRSTDLGELRAEPAHSARAATSPAGAGDAAETRAADGSPR